MPRLDGQLGQFAVFGRRKLGARRITVRFGLQQNIDESPLQPQVIVLAVRANDVL